MNIHTELLPDNDDTFNTFASLFLRFYIKCNVFLDKSGNEITDNDGFLKMIQNINEGNESAESLTHKILMFIFNEFGKITFDENGKISKIESKNTITNWTEIERENFHLIYKKVSSLFDQAVDQSYINEKEGVNEDWFLDHLNFTNKFLSASAINFDDLLSDQQYYDNMTNWS